MVDLARARTRPHSEEEKHHVRRLFEVNRRALHVCAMARVRPLTDGIVHRPPRAVEGGHCCALGATWRLVE